MTVKKAEEPSVPLTPLAKRYLTVFLISTVIGMIMVFLSVAGRRQQLIEETKAKQNETSGQAAPAPEPATAAPVPQGQ